MQLTQVGVNRWGISHTSFLFGSSGVVQDPDQKSRGFTVNKASLFLPCGSMFRLGGTRKRRIGDKVLTCTTYHA